MFARKKVLYIIVAIVIFTSLLNVVLLYGNKNKSIQKDFKMSDYIKDRILLVDLRQRGFPRLIIDQVAKTDDGKDEKRKRIEMLFETYESEYDSNIVKHRELGVKGFDRNQDGAVFNHKLIRASSEGTVNVYDLIREEKIDTYFLPEPIPHANCVFFGEKYDSNDEYPIIYMNYYNNKPKKKGLLYGYRIKEVDNSLVFELIQTISVGFTNEAIWSTGDDNRDYGNFFYDENGCLYAYTTLDGNQNVTRFFRFKMPIINEDEKEFVLNKDDIIEFFDVEKMSYPQGCCYYNGFAICLFGWNGDACLVDLEAKKTKAFFNFSGIASGEPELIDATENYLIYGAGSSVMKIKIS